MEKRRVPVWWRIWDLPGLVGKACFAIPCTAGVQASIARAQRLGTSVSLTPAEYQASIIELTSTMVRNRETNDAKFVQPT